VRLRRLKKIGGGTLFSLPVPAADLQLVLRERGDPRVRSADTPRALQQPRTHSSASTTARA